jgi:predicted ArsR family transcriptional regulator
VNRLDALGDPELRGTFLFVRSRARAITADEAARELGVPRSAARWRLERLAAARLVVVGYERRSGKRGPGAGRPAKTYAAAAETEAIEFPRRRYETLLRLLVAGTPRRGRAARLAEVGYAFGLELGRAAQLRRGVLGPAALERMCRALGGLGFHAALESVSQDGAVILTATCPLRPLVVADPDLRPIDAGMWRGLVAAAAGPDAASRVRCGTHDCVERDAPCRVELDFSRPAGR